MQFLQDKIIIWLNTKVKRKHLWKQNYLKKKHFNTIFPGKKIDWKHNRKP